MYSGSRGEFRLNRKYDSYIPWAEMELFHNGSSCDAGRIFGCHWVPDLQEYRFLVWAPHAKQVNLVGDFSGWNPEPMERLSGGEWCLFTANAVVGQYYKYLVQSADGSAVYKADPFAAFSQCGSETASIVWNGGHYCWHDQLYLQTRAEKNFLVEPMSMYEVHPGSWLHGEPCGIASAYGVSL